MHTLTMRQGRRLHLPSRGMAFLLAASLPLLPASAMAQSAGEDGEENFAIEEVIVTAQRREQGLMDVPVAVTAFTGEQLERMGALDIIALTQTTPNTTLEVSRGTRPCIPKTWLPISSAKTGSVRTSPIQKRLVMSINS